LATTGRAITLMNVAAKPTPNPGLPELTVEETSHE
jgi:hypothetical protein